MKRLLDLLNKQRDEEAADDKEYLESLRGEKAELDETLRKLRDELSKADTERRSLKGSYESTQRSINGMQGGHDPSATRSSSVTPAGLQDALGRLEGANGRRVQAQDDLQNASKRWGNKLSLFGTRETAGEREKEN